jgi:Cft2 family RNA processing exonuclease
MGWRAHRGNVLIPTFAFHRSQEMAERKDQAIESGLLPKRNVYMLSKLAKENEKNQELLIKYSRENQHFLETALHEHKEEINISLTDLKKDLKEQKDSINASLSSKAKFYQEKSLN